MKYQSVTLIKYPSRIVVHGSYITDVGLGLANSDNAKVYNCTEINLDILERIKSILNENEIVVKHPTDWKKQTARYFEALGFSSNNQYMKSAKMISITRINDEITMVPMINSGTKGENKGFHPIEEKKVIVTYNEKSELLINTISNSLMNAVIEVEK